MGCTTILVGKKASYDGSTTIPVPVIICQKNLWWFIHRNSRGNINL